jgi:catechol 2,3-dioxygenase-like lactoylglutathione lyase family enzyme
MHLEQFQNQIEFDNWRVLKILPKTRGVFMGINIRYIVKDVDAAIEFYRDHLGFEVEMSAPGFAALSRNGTRLLLNVPGAGGAGVAGGNPEPGGWNRFQLEVDDLEKTVERLRSGGVTFRGELVEGRGGNQILAEDPSGNPIELFQPAK